MVDADYAVNNTWRLRVAAKRMQSECLHRSIPVCAKAVQIRLYSGTTIFYTTRVFPTEEVGTDNGWRYFYPVHEVCSLVSVDAHMWNLSIALLSVMNCPCAFENF